MKYFENSNRIYEGFQIRNTGRSGYNSASGGVSSGYSESRNAVGGAARNGYSGAGKSVHKKYKNKNLYESLKAYGVGFHRHNSEIEQELAIHTKKKIKFIFTPHLSPMFRGILSTIYVNLNSKYTLKDIRNTLEKFHYLNK